MRFRSAFAFDIRFQWRHGFYWIYVIICAFYLVLLHLIPDHYREQTMLLLTFSDPSALGLILAGGLCCWKETRASMILYLLLRFVLENICFQKQAHCLYYPC